MLRAINHYIFAQYLGMMACQKESIMRQRILIVLCALSLGLIGCSEQLPESYQPLPQSISISGVNLYDQNAKIVTDANLKSKLSLVFFGYT